MTDNSAENDKQVTADVNPAADTQGNVDKIRDILFGGQMRDYEQRFAQLENRIVADTRRLADDLNARFEQLDAYMRDEFKAQGERLASERQKRKQGIDDNEANLADARKALEQKVADVDDSLSVAAQEIRARLHDQASELLDIIRRSKDELSDNIREQSSQLRNDKVAREDLANLLKEVAMRLSGEFDLPDEG